MNNKLLLFLVSAFISTNLFTMEDYNKLKKQQKNTVDSYVEKLKNREEIGNRGKLQKIAHKFLQEHATEKLKQHFEDVEMFELEEEENTDYNNLNQFTNEPLSPCKQPSRKVQFNSPSNTIREYALYSPEKREKKEQWQEINRYKQIARKNAVAYKKKRHEYITKDKENLIKVYRQTKNPLVKQQISKLMENQILMHRFANAIHNHIKKDEQ